MADRTDGDLLAFFDSARPNARYWATIVLLCIASGVEFFDFYIVGFLVAVIGPLWHLTYGQSAIMLLSAGLGAIAGSLIGGALADVFGRKSLIVFGGIVCAASAGAISLVPDGAWLLFALLRAPSSPRAPHRRDAAACRESRSAPKWGVYSAVSARIGAAEPPRPAPTPKRRVHQASHVSLRKPHSTARSSWRQRMLRTTQKPRFAMACGSIGTFP